jgi:uncharacterized protein with GYD domain
LYIICTAKVYPSGSHENVDGRNSFSKYQRQEEIMPLYIMMSNLTDEGRKTVKANPHRILEVNKEVEAMGVKILAQYVTLGQYDFINVLEAPNNEAIANVAMELGSRGTLQTSTLSALTLENFIKAIQ